MGHIKLDRKILEWEWYTDINTCRLFLHMLLRANWKDGRFQGVDIPRGSFVSSYQNIAAETGLSVQNVRTAIKHLKSTGELTVIQHAKFSVFTVNNYCLYQSDNTVANNQTTGNQQSANRQLTTIEEEKEVKKGRSNNKTFVPPAVEEVQAYCLERRNTVDPQTFVDFYTSKGWMVGKNKMKDWKSAVRTWERNRTPGSTAKRSEDVADAFLRRGEGIDQTGICDIDQIH